MDHSADKELAEWPYTNSSGQLLNVQLENSVP